MKQTVYPIAYPVEKTKQTVHRFAYSYCGSGKNGTYFDCLVTDTLIDGQLVVVDVHGKLLIVLPFMFTKMGEVEIDLSKVERFNIVQWCKVCLCMLCDGYGSSAQLYAEMAEAKETELAEEAAKWLVEWRRI